jgi:diguanylate cyclase (GGDEF)-like protein
MSNPNPEPVASNPDGRRPSRILIANDQEWAARSIESILVAEGYEVQRAYTGRQALQRALELPPDLIILDNQMPDLSGAEVCRQLRLDPRIGHATPILLSTAGPAGRQQRIEAYRAGAWEFYGQPLDPELLLLKIRIYLEVRVAAGRLLEETLLDDLTGLYNAKGMLRRTEEVLADARRHQREISLITVMLDDNPHVAALETAGDLARRMGEIVRSSVRAADVVGRIGPLRFAIVSAGGAREGAQRLADRLVIALHALRNGQGPLDVRALIHEVPLDEVTRADARALLGSELAMP